WHSAPVNRLLCVARAGEAPALRPRTAGGRRHDSVRLCTYSRRMVRLNQAIDGWHMGCRSRPLEDANNVPDHTISLPGVSPHPGLRMRTVVTLAGPGLDFDGHSGRG